MKESCHSVVMIAGDSGDGIQLIGNQLTYAHARFGHVVQTIADFPAEIRAPAGTTHGVSGYCLAFSSRNLSIVPLDLDYAVVFNPAAYLSVRSRCTHHTVLIFDQDKWTEKDWLKAGCEKNPLEIHSGHVIPIALTALTCAACPTLSHSQAKKNRNILALGLMLWLHDLPLEPAMDWLSQHFSKKIVQKDAVLACLKAGYYLGETLELPALSRPKISATLRSRGRYAQVTGHQSLVLGLLSCAEKYQRKVILSGYPITPASDVLHIAHQWSDCGIEMIQAEDEISAAGIALGASYAGALGATCTSGPGFDLKSEMIGLAVMAELPMVIINIQRCGPSTGMPTKTEQTDLLAALYGRHGECGVPILAQSHPQDGQAIIELAFDWAIRAMTPVIVLSDALLAQGSAPILLTPQKDSLENKKDIVRPAYQQEGPFVRNAQGVRAWLTPGTPSQAHCNGGLEKDYDTGEISYEGANHEKMIGIRKQKIEALASTLAEPQYTPKIKRYLWIGYGSVSGGLQEYHYQHPSQESTYLILREIYPLPKNFWQLCAQYEYLITVELADGQLARYLRGFAKHPHILSYSQVNAAALDLSRLDRWFHQWPKKEEETL